MTWCKPSHCPARRGLFFGDFHLDTYLITTNFSCLFRAFSTSASGKFIFKWLRRSTSAPNEVEANRLFCDEPTIASALQSFPIYGSFGFLIPEYTGGDLLSYCAAHDALPEPHVCAIAGRVARALFTMHQRGWAHLDVKLDNVLLDDTAPVPNSFLADLGLARPITADKFVGACGTFDYCAPELVMRIPFDKAVDMWALGVVVFMMVCGRRPFPDSVKDEYEFTEAVLAGEYDVAALDAVGASDDCKDAIARLLCIDPRKRMTAKQAVEHRFFAKSEAAAVKCAASRLEWADAQFTEPGQAI
jgi:serine/threonine protein kinase